MVTVNLLVLNFFPIISDSSRYIVLFTLYYSALQHKISWNISELIKAANHLLGTFEPGLLWDWLSGQLISKNSESSKEDNKEKKEEDNNKLFVPSTDPDFEEILSLTDFLLEIVSFVSLLL